MEKCLVCFKEFNSFLSVQKHVRYSHTLSSKQYFDKYIKKNGIGKCEVCNKDTRYVNLNKGYRDFCSVKCMRASERISDKRIKTTKERLGVDNASQSKEIQKRKEDTCNKNYKTSYYLQSSEGKENFRNTCLSKYGKEYPGQVEFFKEKSKKTCLEKYGVMYGFLQEDVINKNRKRYLEDLVNKLEKYNLSLLDKNYIRAKSWINVLCKICGKTFQTKFNLLDTSSKRGLHYFRCPECFPKLHGDSLQERSVRKFLINLGFEVETNNKRLIIPYEIDIYIPSKKIAVEYNGLYWHSENNGRDKNYHLNKLNKCLENGINLIQIFEDEWLFKQDLVKSRLRQILGVNNNERIHARKCIIREIDSKTKNNFLEKYHLQGKDSSNVKLGAFFNKELVSVMTFSKGSIAKGAKYKEGVWELNRFCSYSNYCIPGIASKLLTYFKRNYFWKEIFSYADRRWSVGNLYFRLGFSLENTTRPNYWYVKNGFRFHRFSLRKRFNEPKDVPEWLLRLEEGYTRIWDCGHLKFVFKK